MADLVSKRQRIANTTVSAATALLDASRRAYLLAVRR